MSPERVGRYLLYRQIAAGGYASVHLGRLDGQAGFSRAVAIKRLHPQFAKDPAIVRMFLEEARLSARVKHPNVVSIHDVVAEDGELFLVMDFVRGASLWELMERAASPIDPALAVGIVTQALRGLHAAHEARGEDQQPLAIVHRDVSPQNVLIGENGIARVADFGIAKAVGQSQTTAEGRLKGKIRYMAPEQVRGERVDRRADIYASGVVLWEMLTGVPLFGGEAAAVLYDVLSAPVAPPSSVAAGVAHALDDVVMKALSRAPDERFPDALAFAVALEDVQPGASPALIAAWIRSLPESPRAAERQGLAELLAEIEATEPYAGPRASQPTTGGPTPPAMTLAPAQRSPANDRRPEDKKRTLARLAIPAAGAVVLVGLVTLGALKMLERPVAAPAASLPPACGECPEGTTCESGACVGCVAAIFAGNSALATCAVRKDGELLCWGNNDRGLLGPESTPNAPRPVKLPGLRKPSHLELTPDFALAIVDRKLVGWGRNQSGVLGASLPRGDTTLEPGRATFPLDDVQHVSTTVNGVSACAAAGGKALCWGANEAGQHGEGELSAETRMNPSQIMLPVSGDVTHVEHGGIGTVCAKTATAKWSCWGNTDVSSDTISFGRKNPRDPKSPIEKNFTIASPDARDGADALVLGGRGGCLLSAGKIRCFGSNQHCQVLEQPSEAAIRDAVDRPVPEALATRGAQAIAAGYAHFCAIDTQDELWCWGATDFGQAGAAGGNVTSKVCTPQRIPIAGKVASMALGLRHTCALTEAGEVFCFGKNDGGQVGIGSTGEPVPAPARVPIRCD